MNPSIPGKRSITSALLFLLTEAETRNTARRAFQANNRLTASEIGRAIGRSRQAVDKYIADLRATALFEQDLKVFKLHQLGVPQDRIAKRVGLGQQRISRYLLQMPQVAKGVNTDLRVTLLQSQLIFRLYGYQYGPAKRDVNNLIDFEKQLKRPVQKYLFYTGTEYTQINHVQLLPVACLHRGI